MRFQEIVMQKTNNWEVRDLVEDFGRWYTDRKPKPLAHLSWGTFSALQGFDETGNEIGPQQPQQPQRKKPFSQRFSQRGALFGMSQAMRQGTSHALLEWPLRQDALGLPDSCDSHWVMLPRYLCN